MNIKKKKEKLPSRTIFYSILIGVIQEPDKKKNTYYEYQKKKRKITK
jgi:hypothetical protein